MVQFGMIQTLFEQKLKGSDTILCVIGYQKPYVMLLVAYKNAGKLKHAGVIIIKLHGYIGW